MTPTVTQIITAAAALHRCTTVRFLSEERTQALAHARQRAMYLARELTARSLPDIGRRFGGRDHTTVLHAVRRVTERLSSTETEARELARLRSALTKPPT